MTLGNVAKYREVTQPMGLLFQHLGKILKMTVPNTGQAIGGTVTVNTFIHGGEMFWYLRSRRSFRERESHTKDPPFP